MAEAKSSIVPSRMDRKIDTKSSLEKRARMAKARANIGARSDAHGHHDVAVARRFVGDGTQLAGGLFVFQLEVDGAVGGGEEIEEVLGVEADGDRIAFEFFLDDFLGFA